MKLHRDIPEENVRNVFEVFKGEIYQVPPSRAAVKRSLRVRKIHELKLLQKKGKFVLFQVNCQSGTYVRKLCVDIGRVLKVRANMVSLRRIKTGTFHEDQSFTLPQITLAYYLWKTRGVEEPIREVVKPLDSVLNNLLPAILIKDSAVEPVKNGFPLMIPGIIALSSKVPRGGIVSIQKLNGEIIAVAKTVLSSEEIYKKKRGVAAKPIKVLV